MARTITLLALRNRIRERGEVRSAFISDAVLNDWINLAVCELTDVLVDADPSWRLSSATVDIVSGTSSYALPSDFYLGRGVDVLTTASDWERLTPFNFEDRHLFDDNPANREDMCYSFQGSSIYLSPEPNWSETAGLKIWYIPVVADLSSDSSTLDGVNGWDEYIVLSVIMRCKEKAEEDIGSTSALMAQQVQRIQRLARRRDYANPQKIRDVYSEDYFRLKPWERLPRP